MKIVNLTENSTVYTSNAWFVTGTWKALGDPNTLVDAGMDPGIVHRLRDADTGVGQRKLDQIILTHNHYDHTGQVMLLKKEYGAKVFAYSGNHDGVDHILKNGEWIHIGDRLFEVIHMPGHSSDSILLFNQEDGVLFAGDSPMVINTAEGEHEEAFITVLEKLTRLPVQTIYFGHGKPMTEGCTEVLKRSLKFAMEGS